MNTTLLPKPISEVHVRIYGRALTAEEIAQHYRDHKSHEELQAEIAKLRGLNDLQRYTLDCREADIARLEEDLACAEANGDNLQRDLDALEIRVQSVRE